LPFQKTYFSPFKKTFWGKKSFFFLFDKKKNPTFFFLEEKKIALSHFFVENYFKKTFFAFKNHIFSEP